MSLKEKELLKIEVVCLASTAELFAGMINEENRGPNFEWSKFPNLAKRLGSRSVMISQLWPENKKDEIREYAEKFCEQIANNYIIAAGLGK